MAHHTCCCIAVTCTPPCTRPFRASRSASRSKLVGLEQSGDGVALRFADGGRAAADAVIGADGVHSKVREILLGVEKPRFTGRVAHRTVFPTALMGGFALDTCTKWWGPDRHIVMYPVTAEREETYFVTSVPDPDWNVESWSAEGDMDEVRRAFAGFHSEVQRVLDACPRVHKWALFERDPLPCWSRGPVALLGDACHPMMPYMAQGGASALEDAAMLARCLGAESDPEAALLRYQAARLQRTARLQLTSRENTWGTQSDRSQLGLRLRHLERAYRRQRRRVPSSPTDRTRIKSLKRRTAGTCPHVSLWHKADIPAHERRCPFLRSKQT